MIKLEQLTLPIKYTKDDILKQVCAKLKITKDKFTYFELIKLSIDARKKPNIKYIASVGVCLKGNLENKYKNLKFVPNNRLLEYPIVKSEKKIVVVGFGPSGMFSALALARMGLKPLIIEQGKQVLERENDVLNFWNNRKLNKYSNVQFGEGGAGTFSDGKLNTNLNNDYCKMVINELINFGAPKEIGYINKPHIGSDNLKNVVANLRKHIKSLGGTFMFSTKLDNVIVKDNQVSAIEVTNVETNTKTTLPCDNLLLCVGHSARDTFKMLYDLGVTITQKPFAMGVRIEQKQKDINLAQYGAEHIDGLPNADYKLVTHLENGRSVFTFCMCPGGEIVASSSNENEVVTNGMSYFARDKENANSAVLVNVKPSDYESTHPLAGLDFQAKYEKLAFELGGKNFNAPAMSVGDFLNCECQDNNAKIENACRSSVGIVSAGAFISGKNQESLDKTSCLRATVSSDIGLESAETQTGVDCNLINSKESNNNINTTQDNTLMSCCNIKTNINPTYKPNLTFCDISKCLPDFVTESLKLGLKELGKKLKGFDKPENLLVAIESRSSCPLTIVRDDNYQSNIKGLYPVGEGAGYAGGIISSAQDGVKVAESIYKLL